MKKIMSAFLLGLMLCRCTGPEPYDSILCDFNYKNTSDSDATMTVYYASPKADEIFNIKSKSTVSFSNIDYGEPRNPFSTKCDSVTIKFNEQKQRTYTFKDKDPKNPLFLESYAKTELNYHHFIFDYTISIDNF